VQHFYNVSVVIQTSMHSGPPAEMAWYMVYSNDLGCLWCRQDHRIGGLAESAGISASPPVHLQQASSKKVKRSTLPHLRPAR
jgi:hypothetical protein